jgi:hypothetical protein
LSFASIATTVVILSEPGSPRTGLRPWGGEAKDPLFSFASITTTLVILSEPGSPRTGLRPWGGEAKDLLYTAMLNIALQRINPKNAHNRGPRVLGVIAAKIAQQTASAFAI